MLSSRKMTRVIFFDGYCHLCNALVDWLIRQDRAGHLRFASLQGATAQELLQGKEVVLGHGGLRLAELDTVVYLRGATVFLRSTAIIEVLADLGGPWRALRVFLWIPRPLRDALYSAWARRRYQLFGRRATCRVPGPDEQHRFLA